MKSIYIDNKHITFTDSLAGSATEGMIISNPRPEEITATNLLENLRKTKSITVLSPDYEKIFEHLRQETGFVVAAGGVVHSSNGMTLMIFRNGRWDLPKGHLEKGETIGECALREVTEECGIRNLILGRFLTETVHVYTLNGQTVFKATSWFDMSCPVNCMTTPQREEGIEKAEWLPEARIREILPTSYQTIRDVFAAYYTTEPKNRNI